MRLNVVINGENRQADDVWEGESLLYVLRERLGLPGSKNACEQGECGSCTVYLDDLPVCACLVAAGQAEGRVVRTVEGLADGDTHPVLLVLDARIEVASVRGSRFLPADEFYVGVKRHALEPDELITAVHLPAHAGPQQFAKVGTRNAMVIAVCSFALALRDGQVGAAIGSAAPTPRHAREAEEFLAGELPWGSSEPLADSLKRRFGELVAEATSPIDDVRGSAAYRKHALGVLARRTLTWAWDEHRTGERACA